MPKALPVFWLALLSWFSPLAQSPTRSSIKTLPVVASRQSAILYRDADWATNPAAYGVEKKQVTSETNLTLHLA